MKNECFDEKLKNLETSSLYKMVLSQFMDTFEILKKEKELFGVPSYVENKIDDAIFFDKDSSRCLLIVLQRMKDTLYVFGSARVIRGVSIGGRWKFDVSLQYDFEKDYFKDYPKNSYQNIAKLARYGVMVGGNPGKNGCEINEEYWFKTLK